MIYKIEKWIKERLFACQTCGQCLLSNTSLICPMNCPKGLRNGPCGGTLDGKCEVIPEIDCVWTRIESKRGESPEGIQLPLDPELYRAVAADDFPESTLRWAFEIAEGVSEVGAAGVHAMNFAMPPDLIDQFLVETRSKANKVRQQLPEVGASQPSKD